MNLEHIGTDKIKSLLKATKKSHTIILEEIENGSYSFQRLAELKSSKKLVADNIKELTEELKSRVGLFKPLNPHV